MTTSTKLHIAAYSIIVIAAGLFLRGWIDDHILKAKAEAVAEAQKTVIDSAQKSIDQRQQDFVKQIADLKQQMAQVKTPAQAVVYIPQAANLPAPIQQPAAVKPDIAGKLPDAPSGSHYALIGDGAFVLPPADALPLAQKLNACEQTGIGLTKCDADKKDLQAQIDAANLEAHAWKVAAKGGTKREKFVKALKVIGCAAGGGALGGLSPSHQSGAAIGAGAGATLCTLF